MQTVLCNNFGLKCNTISFLIVQVNYYKVYWQSVTNLTVDHVYLFVRNPILCSSLVLPVWCYISSLAKLHHIWNMHLPTVNLHVYCNVSAVPCLAPHHPLALLFLAMLPKFQILHLSLPLLPLHHHLFHHCPCLWSSAPYPCFYAATFPIAFPFSSILPTSPILLGNNYQ